MKKSELYGRLLRVTYLSVALTGVGAGVYAVLSDNGIIPQPKKVRSDSKIGKTVAFIKDVFSKQ